MNAMTNPQLPNDPLDVVPDYLQKLRQTDFATAYHYMLQTYNWDIAQAVSWHCLETGLTARVGGKIFAV